MTWDEEIAAAAPDFTDTFGEPVTYTPSGGSPRTIQAIVDRDPPERIAGAGDLYAPKMTIDVQNDPVNGIDSSAMNLHGADTVTVAYRVGGTPQTFGVYLPPPGQGPQERRANDAGMISLDLR